MAVLVILTTALILHYILNMVPIIKRVAEERIRAYAASSVARAATDIITDSYAYDDLVDVVKNNSGDVVLIQANTPLMHALSRNAVARTEYYINQAENLRVTIPLGTLSGIAFLGGYGPDILIKTLPVGVVASNLHSEFISAGINQTLHKIYITVHTEVTVVLPGLSSRVLASVPIPIAENTIIGKVPDFYFQSGLFDKALNLIP